MQIKQLSLKEYLEKKPKSYLEQCLENGTAEFYVVTYNNKSYDFFFYKENDIADISIKAKSIESLFDYEDVMNEIFEILRNRHFRYVTIDLPDCAFPERKVLAKKYGFVEKQKIPQGENSFTLYILDLEKRNKYK